MGEFQPQSGRAQHGSAAPSVGLPPQIAHDDCAGNGAAAGGGAGAAHWRVVCSTSTASAQRTARLAMSLVMPRVVDESCDPYKSVAPWSWSAAIEHRIMLGTPRLAKREN